MLLGLAASGDGRHPGGVVAPQCRFSVFLELESLEEWAPKGRWEHPAAKPSRSLKPLLSPLHPAALQILWTMGNWILLTNPALRGAGGGGLLRRGVECVQLGTVT